jgi:hypothetical protein
MYLSKLYRRHKGWFAFVLLFIIGQLFIDAKHGVVFSPFFQFGMFSAVSRPQPTYEMPEIRVNGRTLSPGDFSPQVWDKINLPVARYEHWQERNSVTYHEVIARVTGFRDSSVYLRSYPREEFLDWYATHLSSILKEKVDSLELSYLTAAWDGHSFTVMHKRKL